MIDLHLHLDGALTPGEILYLAEKHNILLPVKSEKELAPFLTAKKTADLNEYLEKFDIPLMVLQSEEAIEKAVYFLLKRLENLGVKYAEIRFAPQLHTKRGLTQKQVVFSACRGLSLAMSDFKIWAQLILCCMRLDKNEKENKETVSLAAKFKDMGVCALDLAGAEGLYKTASFKSIFSEANRFKVPFTIHAGEADGADSIRSAIELGAKRIGHGVRLAEDKGLLELVADNKIPLEMCPSSNVQTGAVKNIKEHPVLKFLEKGVCVTVNSDNMTVSGTDVFAEFSLLERELGMTNKQKEIMLNNAVDAAFLTDDEKRKLKALIKNGM